MAKLAGALARGSDRAQEVAGRVDHDDVSAAFVEDVKVAVRVEGDRRDPAEGLPILARERAHRIHLFGGGGKHCVGVRGGSRARGLITGHEQGTRQSEERECVSHQGGSSFEDMGVLEQFDTGSRVRGWLARSVFTGE